MTMRTMKSFGRGLAMLLLLAVFLLPSVQAQVGGAAVVFLKIEPDARAAGMGNAGVALADNASAIFWNPAGLAFQTGTEASITHSNWLPEFDAGLFYEYLTVKHQIPGWGTFGGHVTYLFLGEHERRDAQNVFLGTFRSYDLSVGASYAAKMSKNLAVGLGSRFIYSNLASGQVGEQETSPGISAGFDLSALYKSPKFNLGGMKGNVNLGANLNNMGPTIQYSDEAQADPIPTNLRFGYALNLEFDEYNALSIVTDFNKDLIHVERDTLAGENVVDPFYKAIFSGWQSIDVCTLPQGQCEDGEGFESLSALDQMTIGAGMEYWYNKLFALRTGYFYENPYNGNRKFLTLGAGVRYNIVGVDFSYIYALQEDSPLANTMRFSLLLNFGKK
jgi:long-subunit fatty acid transport protein